MGLITTILVAALFLAPASGCASIARRHCEEVYCGHVEAPADCEHTEDLVPICIEDRLEDYDTFWGWWAATADWVMQTGKAVAL